MKQLKALIVDDEPNALDGFLSLLRTYCPEIDPAGTATSVSDALRKIVSGNYELVFLDIEMPEGSGFDLVEAIRAKNMALVFVTAHADYAVSAFKADAVDYLLKPVSGKDLRAAVARATVRLQNPAQTGYRVRINAAEGIRFISCGEIVGIEGDGRYSVIHTSDGKSQLVSRNIGDYEVELEAHGFFRVHKSWLVNCSHVSRLTHTDGGTIELSNGKKVLLSRRKKNEFLKRMDR